MLSKFKKQTHKVTILFRFEYQRPVLVVEEAEYREKTTDHGQATSQLFHLQLRVECTVFVIYKARR
jgi:hypothetical protein